MHRRFARPEIALSPYPELDRVPLRILPVSFSLPVKTPIGYGLPIPTTRHSRTQARALGIAGHVRGWAKLTPAKQDMPA